MRRRYLGGAFAGAVITAAALAIAWSAAASAARPASIHPQGALHMMKPLSGSLHSAKGGKHGPPGGGGSNNLSYHGGVAGIGVETTPKVYLVFWGSQWTNNDPSGEAGILQGFLGNVGGSNWLNSVTQYCQGVNVTTSCNSKDTPAGNPSGILINTWSDTGSAAPARPKQSDLAAEAVRAAAHFQNTGVGSNDTTQYIIATATGDNPSGFGHQYCAWHSYTSSSYGNIAYTNLPYITDAGPSCGANFVSKYTDGITIVEGHELAETITDQFPSGGWLDGNGEENGDKCAWDAATKDVTFGSSSYAVQPLWSNKTSDCVMSY